MEITRSEISILVDLFPVQCFGKIKDGANQEVLESKKYKAITGILPPTTTDLLGNILRPEKTAELSSINH